MYSITEIKRTDIVKKRTDLKLKKCIEKISFFINAVFLRPNLNLK